MINGNSINKRASKKMKRAGGGGGAGGGWYLVFAFKTPQPRAPTAPAANDRSNSEDCCT